jgi:hypothetical protein
LSDHVLFYNYHLGAQKKSSLGIPGRLFPRGGVYLLGLSKNENDKKERAKKKANLVNFGKKISPLLILITYTYIKKINKRK